MAATQGTKGSLREKNIEISLLEYELQESYKAKRK